MISLLGDTQGETLSKFNNYYKDLYVESVNKLIRHLASINDIDKLKVQFAMDLSLAGIGITKRVVHGLDWRYQRVPPEQFGWDRSATDPQLLDSEYFYEYETMSPSTIFEIHQEITPSERMAIEVCHGCLKDRKLPVYTSVWRDIIVDDYGYVEDEFGQVVLKRLDFIEEGEDKPRYKLSDAIAYKKLSTFQQKVLGEKARTLKKCTWTIGGSASLYQRRLLLIGTIQERIKILYWLMILFLIRSQTFTGQPT